MDEPNELPLDNYSPAIFFTRQGDKEDRLRLVVSDVPVAISSENKRFLDSLQNPVLVRGVFFSNSTAVLYSGCVYLISLLDHERACTDQVSYPLDGYKNDIIRYLLEVTSLQGIDDDSKDNIFQGVAGYIRKNGESLEEEVVYKLCGLNQSSLFVKQFLQMMAEGDFVPQEKLLAGFECYVSNMRGKADILGIEQLLSDLKTNIKKNALEALKDKLKDLSLLLNDKKEVNKSAINELKTTVCECLLSFNLIPSQNVFVRSSPQMIDDKICFYFFEILHSEEDKKDKNLVEAILKALVDAPWPLGHHVINKMIKEFGYVINLASKEEIVIDDEILVAVVAWMAPFYLGGPENTMQNSFNTFIGNRFCLTDYPLTSEKILSIMGHPPGAREELINEMRQQETLPFLLNGLQPR